ncbi:MAG: hypothetical protein HZB79_02565 [Deltaproteobacteria bacterium]|nr:hypothetical protein [Deltaproteobacteria bacterium]
MRKIYLCSSIFIFTILIVLSLSTLAIAGDLDDKIGKYTDDDIQSDHEMGEFNPNIKFKKMDAKSKAKVRQKKGDKSKDGSSSSKSGSGKTDASGNMNSVVLGPGGSVKGDIIIIDESRGPKTQIVDK